LGVELHKVNSTIGQKKLTHSCLCKLPINPRGRSCLRLVDPKTSSPSKWGILNVYEEPEINLITTIAICKRSLDWLALNNCAIHPYLV